MMLLDGISKQKHRNMFYDKILNIKNILNNSKNHRLLFV